MHHDRAVCAGGAGKDAEGYGMDYNKSYPESLDEEGCLEVVRMITALVDCVDSVGCFCVLGEGGLPNIHAHKDGASALRNKFAT